MNFRFGILVGIITDADQDIDIRDQCIAAGVPFYFKQWGGVNREKHGCLVKRKKWDQMPEIKVPGQDLLLCI